MRQVVTEKWNGNSVEITLSYAFEKSLVGTKQYQEITTPTINGKIVMYWIEVANDGAGATKRNPNFAAEARSVLQKKERNMKKRDKNARIKKNIDMYRQMVADGKVLFGCDRDDCFSF